MKACLRVVGAALYDVVAVVAFAADDAVRLMRNRIRPARDLGHVGAVKAFSPTSAGVRTVKLPRGGDR